MAKKETTEHKEAQDGTTETETPKKKTCFVIMPISDPDGYEKGHFDRVYKHLIKPACEAAGYETTRADEIAETNVIIIDVLKQIYESDMALCDLSGRNPNVLYELGIRHSFNRPVVVIKDRRTKDIFDVNMIRAVYYTESLRVDTVQNDLPKITTSLIETAEAKDGLNSILQLMGLSAAKLETKEISGETELILEAISSLEYRKNSGGIPVPSKSGRLSPFERARVSISHPEALFFDDYSGFQCVRKKDGKIGEIAGVLPENGRGMINCYNTKDGRLELIFEISRRDFDKDWEFIPVLE